MIRTIDQAYEELKKRDPETAISKWLVRQMVIHGQVPCIKSGSKWLVDVDVLEDYVGRATRGELKDNREAANQRRRNSFDMER